MSRARPSRRLLASLAISSTLALAACGDSEGGSGASGEGLTTLTPADAPLYIETVVQPEGDAREAIERLYTAASGMDDPGAAIIDEIDASAEESGVDFSWSEDVEPWLGERAGLFFGDSQSLIESGAGTDLDGCVADQTLDGGTTVPEIDAGCAESEDSSDTPENFAFLIETTDEDAAQESIDRLVEIGAEEEGSEVSDETYEDVDYRSIVTPGDPVTAAVGIVDGAVVVGDQAGFEAAVDASAGDSLADDSEFTDGLSQLSDEPFAALYADAPALVAAAEESGSIAPEDQAALEFYRGYVSEPVFLTAEIDSDAVEFASSTGASGYELSAEGLLDELPADSFTAFGFPSLGEYVQTTLDQLAANEEFGSELDAGLRQFEAETGVALEDTLGGLGDLTGFVRGDSVFSIDGAVSLQIDDPQGATKLIDAARQGAEGSGERTSPVDGVPGLEDASGFSITPEGAPQEVFVVVSGDRLIVSYGAEAASEAVSPSEPLGDSESFADASEDLEDVDPSFFIDAEPIQQLLNGIPIPTDDPAATGALQAFGEFDYLIGGAGTADDRDITRYRLGLDEGE